MQNLLALDASTDTLSLAVARGARQWVSTSAGGALASATALPLLLDLLRQAELAPTDLHAVVLGRGPGSFTGVRTACALAQGLALGAGCPVLPVDTLLALAEEARHQHGATRVAALLDARMDEIYAAWYVFEHGSWQVQRDCALIRPEDPALADPGWVCAGNVFAPYGARIAAGAPHLTVLPTASALLRLASALLQAGRAVAPAQALPLYVRDKVAQTTAERAALRQAGAPTPTLTPAATP